MADRDEHGTTSGTVEGVATWCALDQTLAEARTGFADLGPEAVEELVDEAVIDARRSRQVPVPEVRA